MVIDRGATTLAAYDYHDDGWSPYGMSVRLGEVGMTGGKVIENMIRIAGEVP